MGTGPTLPQKPHHDRMEEENLVEQDGERNLQIQTNSPGWVGPAGTGDEGNLGEYRRLHPHRVGGDGAADHQVPRVELQLHPHEVGGDGAVDLPSVGTEGNEKTSRRRSTCSGWRTDLQVYQYQTL